MNADVFSGIHFQSIVHKNDKLSEKPKAAKFVEEILIIPVALGVFATLGTIFVSAVALKLAVTVVVLPSIVLGVVSLTITAIVVSTIAGAIVAFSATLIAVTGLAGIVASAITTSAFAGISLVVAPFIGLAGIVLANLFKAQTPVGRTEQDPNDDPYFYDPSLENDRKVNVNVEKKVSNWKKTANWKWGIQTFIVFTLGAVYIAYK